MADVGLVYKSKISRSVTAAPGSTTSSSTARKLLSALNSTQASVMSAASSSQVPNDTNKHAGRRKTAGSCCAAGAIQEKLDEMKAVVQTIHQVATLSSEQDSISDNEYSNRVPSTSANPNEPTTAQHLKHAVQSGRIDRVKSAKDKSIVVIHKSMTSKMKSVTTYRNTDLFVARIHPTVPDTMIKGCVEDALKSGSDNEESTVAVHCEKLVTKYESYHSYHATVTVDITKPFKQQILFLSHSFSSILPIMQYCIGIGSIANTFFSVLPEYCNTFSK